MSAAVFSVACSRHHQQTPHIVPHARVHLTLAFVRYMLTAAELETTTLSSHASEMNRHFKYILRITVRDVLLDISAIYMLSLQRGQLSFNISLHATLTEVR